MSTPLQSYLSYKLSGIEVTDDEFNRPVCSICDSQGKSNGNLLISTGEPVYACTWWKEWSGWELFGIYHAVHRVSNIVDSNPPRPTAVLRGVIERTDYETKSHHTPDAYTLTALSLETVRYPGSLEHK